MANQTNSRPPALQGSPPGEQARKLNRSRLATNKPADGMRTVRATKSTHRKNIPYRRRFDHRPIVRGLSERRRPYSESVSGSRLSPTSSGPPQTPRSGGSQWILLLTLFVTAIGVGHAIWSSHSQERGSSKPSDKPARKPEPDAGVEPNPTIQARPRWDGCEQLYRDQSRCN